MVSRRKYKIVINQQFQSVFLVATQFDFWVQGAPPQNTKNYSLIKINHILFSVYYQ